MCCLCNVFIVCLSVTLKCSVFFSKGKHVFLGTLVFVCSGSQIQRKANRFCDGSLVIGCDNTDSKAMYLTTMTKMRKAVLASLWLLVIQGTCCYVPVYWYEIFLYAAYVYIFCLYFESADHKTAYRCYTPTNKVWMGMLESPCSWMVCLHHRSL